MLMDNSLAVVIPGKENADIPDFGINLRRIDDMGVHIVQHRRIRANDKQSIWRFLSVYCALMFDNFYINSKPENKMAEGKAIAAVAAWLAGMIGFSYTLLTIDWNNIKAVILLIIGALWSLVNLFRAIIKLIKEGVDLRDHIKNRNK